MLGEFLRQLRLAAGLTVEDIGERLGMARGSAGKWERGETTFSAPQLGAYLEIVGASEADAAEAIRLSRVAGSHLILPRDVDGTDTTAEPSPPITGCATCANYSSTGRCAVQPLRPRIATWRAERGRSGPVGAVAEAGCPGFVDSDRDDATEETTAPPAEAAA